MPFDLDNARKHIARMGGRLRFVSTAGLDDALHYIYTEMEKLGESAGENGLDFQIDMFRSGPSSYSSSVGPVPVLLAYDNISSVVVRLSPDDDHAQLEKALLINAHVDSAQAAPGVNDELSGVGIVMDIIRAIIFNQEPNHRIERPIVFLFNGAEEVILQGAHSFVTQHKWGHDIAAHINLKSIGSGKAYHLFWIGPNSPWLAYAFAKAVSVPFASVTATDVFESKVRSFLFLHLSSIISLPAFS